MTKRCNICTQLFVGVGGRCASCAGSPAAILATATRALSEKATKPTIGRIVHYTSLGDRDGKYPPEIQAAIITGVNPPFGDEEPSVSLHVFYRTGQFDMPEVERTDEPAGSEDARGFWCWPARDS